MKLSKVMLINWLLLLVGLLGLPQLVALVPTGAMPYITLAAGAATLIANWLGQTVGAITVIGILTLVAGLLGIPELLAIIPPQYTNYVVLAASILNLILRSNQATPALKGLLFKTEI